MDDLLARLKTILSGRYDILREIGRGGMATVYLARDLRHPRQVAIKVFRPELAAGASHGRFVREIALASRLSHPNILALYDSGDDDGVLYYVMPYVEGESVAARIEREGKLPIADALVIARQVAAALHHAHKRGVIHRDIKPDNILLSGDTALVADFGIAHAVESIGSERLTATNLAVGTPAFMSPEQITGAGTIDGRADVYSLGCVLYTMLLGEPPFGGSSMQAILARHLAEPVPGIRVVRATVPRAVEAAVQRAMAKAPVDRFASAADFAAALAPTNLSDESLDNILRAPKRRKMRIRAAVGLAIIALALLLKPWSLTRRSASAAPLDRQLAAVFPFNTDEIADSAVRGQLGSVADLIAQRLPGDGGPRGMAMQGPAVSSAEAARSAARNAGAGRVVEGRIAMINGRLVMSATMRDVATDSLLARTDDVSGARDSLPAVLDRLVSQLLLASLGGSPEWRAALSSLALPSIRQYIAGHEHLRLGQMLEAKDLWTAVLAADSTAYPAALSLASIMMLELRTTEIRRPVRLARAQLHRMNMNSDTFQLNSLQLWREDDTTRAMSVADRLERLERAARTDTRSSLKWYLLGERLFHDGPLLGIRDMLRLAAGSFDHVLEIDPDFVPALRHAIDLAAARGDTATVKILAPRYFAMDSVGDLSDFYRWRVAVATDDRLALGQVRQRVGTFSRQSLERIVNVSQLDGIDLADAISAATELWAKSGESAEARWAYVKQRELALNRGRPAEATEILNGWRATQTMFRPMDGLAEVVNALFWGADSAFVQAWVAANEAGARAARPPVGGERWRDIYPLPCGIGLWHAKRGNADFALTMLPFLESGAAMGGDLDDLRLCTAVIRATAVARLGRPDAHARLMTLDSMIQTSPTGITWLLTAANITVAELWERSGDIPRALAAIRRRVYITDIGEQRVLVALSTMLREEGRLAALTGDKPGAILAYRRYLALRDNPEPSLAAEVAAVRAELAKLDRQP